MMKTKRSVLKQLDDIEEITQKLLSKVQENILLMITSIKEVQDLVIVAKELIHNAIDVETVFEREESFKSV